MRKISLGTLFVLSIALSFPVYAHGKRSAKHQHQQNQRYQHQKKHRSDGSDIIFEKFPELRGSKEVIEKGNVAADAACLVVIKEDKLKGTPPPKPWPFFTVDDEVDFHYALPFAIDYLFAVSREYTDHFDSGVRLKLTSFVRPVKYQEALRHRNKNAIPDSLHFRGIAFDVGAKDMSLGQKLYFAGLLARDMESGKILATYEHKGQVNFHIVVMPEPLPLPCSDEL